MKIKTKLTLGVGLLFLMIVLLSVVSALNIYKQKSDTEKILIANYNSLEYSKNMILALDRIDTDSTQTEIFKNNLVLESKNLTEKGEKDSYQSLVSHFQNYQQLPNIESEKLIRNDLVDIMRLNMTAIVQKSDTAIETAETATTWVISLGTICFIIAFTLLFNLPDNIARPIKELTESIKQIANKNYHERVNFEGSEEFEDLANSFNSMAEKLEEYQSSSLSKQLMDKKRVEMLISNMHDPVIGLDENNQINFINEEALKISGLFREDVVGKSAADIAVNNDLLRELLRNAGAEEKLEVPMKIFADNKESYFEQEIIPISIIPTGETEKKDAGKVILLRNITAYKELDFAKTNFIATVSHELKTPISSMKMGTQLLKNEKFGNLNEQQKELLKSIEEDGERLLNITGELLNLSQAESGNIRFNIKDCNVSDLVKTAVSNNLIIAENKEIKLISNLKTKSEDAIKADFDKTVWVLNNFLTNAIKHSEVGQKVIIVTDQIGDKVKFSVQDFGKGIDQKYHSKVFDRYFQIPEDHQTGTGLGLAISKNFIEKQGGSIGLDSEENGGSIFWMTL
ncbi:ATP-binding protein [Kaistella antarctica]|uniref:histidine kinase n=1 Tax=Kaistella antarctica TaxID=266748 RepID=A0A3S4UXT2_9FLAO|nr:ATP-binding protein [Kaistella antarctica]KEY19251.1 histidine kinase [Kaistella antarctica]SEW04621.1 PAS/PAC sensor signal transduction histidine kinase [Kaistella antarctica]VEH98614.1 Alginate biosynthesis sensor protein kinB [Kaistella antarctica]